MSNEQGSVSAIYYGGNLFYDGDYHVNNQTDGLFGLSDDPVLLYGTPFYLWYGEARVPVSALMPPGYEPFLNSQYARISGGRRMYFQSASYGSIAMLSPAQDGDGDGMPDDWEKYYGFDPADPFDAGADANQNGFSNLAEFLMRTDPRQVLGVTAPSVDLRPGIDTDGDWIPNVWEWSHGLNYNDAADAAADPDGDGLTNLQEYRLGTNPHNPDTDGDGLPDGWEIAHGLDPNDNGSRDPNNGPNGDPDQDGLTNLQEQTAGTDPRQSDSDGDGISDTSESEQGTNPNDPNNKPDADWFVIVGDRGPGELKSETRRYTIKKGQSRVVIVGTQSDEFPVWTEPSSQYNDLLEWNINPTSGTSITGAIDVNERHVDWTADEINGITLHGLSVAHIETVKVVQAPADSDITVTVILKATNVSDGALPSRVVVGLLPFEFKLRNEADFEKGWDDTGKEPWTSVGVGKICNIVKLVGATSDFELVVDEASKSYLAISNNTITGGDTNFTISGTADSKDLGTEGAKIIVRKKGETEALKTLHVHVLPERTVRFTIFHASDDRVPQSAVTAIVPPSLDIKAELETTFINQANIRFDHPITHVDATDCFGCFVTGTGDGYYNNGVPGQGSLLFQDVIESNVDGKSNTNKAISFIVVHNVRVLYGNDPDALTNVKYCYMDESAVIQTYAHEAGHALELSTHHDYPDGQPHDKGPDPKGNIPLMGERVNGKTRTHWLRQEDWRKANDAAKDKY